MTPELRAALSAAVPTASGEWWIDAIAPIIDAAINSITDEQKLAWEGIGRKRALLAAANDLETMRPKGPLPSQIEIADWLRARANEGNS